MLFINRMAIAEFNLSALCSNSNLPDQLHYVFAQSLNFDVLVQKTYITSHCCINITLTLFSIQNFFCFNTNICISLKLVLLKRRVGFSSASKDCKMKMLSAMDETELESTDTDDLKTAVRMGYIKKAKVSAQQVYKYIINFRSLY